MKAWIQLAGFAMLAVLGMLTLTAPHADETALVPAVLAALCWLTVGAMNHREHR